MWCFETLWQGIPRHRSLNTKRFVEKCLGCWPAGGWRAVDTLKVYERGTLIEETQEACNGPSAADVVGIFNELLLISRPVYVSHAPSPNIRPSPVVLVHTLTKVIVGRRLGLSLTFFDSLHKVRPHSAFFLTLTHHTGNSGPASEAPHAEFHHAHVLQVRQLCSNQVFCTTLHGSVPIRQGIFAIPSLSFSQQFRLVQCTNPSRHWLLRSTLSVKGPYVCSLSHAYLQDGVLVRGKHALPAAKRALAILDGNNEFGMYVFRLTPNSFHPIHGSTASQKDTLYPSMTRRAPSLIKLNLPSVDQWRWRERSSTMQGS